MPVTSSPARLPTSQAMSTAPTSSSAMMGSHTFGLPGGCTRVNHQR